MFLSTRLNPLTWWVYPPYSVWSSSCWSFVFAGPHRSDLLNIKAVHVHLTYEDSTVRGGPFSISNLFLYRILSLCCLYFAMCLFLTPLVLTDHSTSPHASSYEAMVLQFGYRNGNIDVVDAGLLVCNVINTILKFVAAIRSLQFHDGLLRSASVPPLRSASVSQIKHNSYSLLSFIQSRRPIFFMGSVVSDWLKMTIFSVGLGRGGQSIVI